MNVSDYSRGGNFYSAVALYWRQFDLQLVHRIVPETSRSLLSTNPSANSNSVLKYGGTLKLIRDSIPGAGGWPSSQWSTMNAAAQLCLEGLLRIDNKGNISNRLAESYKLADDRSSITFTLRKNVTFHDYTFQC